MLVLLGHSCSLVQLEIIDSILMILIIYRFLQMVHPEGLFLSKDSRQVWMCRNHVAKPFPLFPDLVL